MSTKFRRVFRRDAKDVENDLLCAACAAAADAVIAARRLGVSKENLQDVVVELCVDLEIETEEVCQGAIASNIVSYYVFELLRQLI